MRIYLLRHGKAEARNTGLDAERALTNEGREELKRVGQAMVLLGVRVDGILTSPLIRARQTAEIAAEALGFRDRIEECEGLSINFSEKALLERLLEWEEDSSLMLVGHSPSLGDFGGRLLGGPGASFLDLGKGSLCLIETEGKPRLGEGQLGWYLLRKHLEILGSR